PRNLGRASGRRALARLLAEAPASSSTGVQAPLTLSGAPERRTVEGSELGPLALRLRSAPLSANGGLNASGGVLGRLPTALARRLALCAAGGQWPRLTLAELSDDVTAPAKDAFVVLSRHSGEVLHASGDFRAPMPFGSTLKPFVYAV